MHNIVVEDERVGKELLVGGRLKKRVMLIPINKISAFRMSAKVCVSPLRFVDVDEAK
jgi:structural maintenance of chromosome 2